MPMFPRVIAEIIADYCAEWELIQHAWDYDYYENKFNIEQLSENPRGCDYLLQIMNHHDDCDFDSLSIDEHRDYIWFWKNITINPGASAILSKYPNKIDLDWIGKRSFPWTECILRKRVNEIRDWRNISTNPIFIDILRANPEKACLAELCTNPAAIDMIEQKIDSVFSMLDSRANLCEQPWAIHLLEKYESELDWKSLSKNHAATHLLRKNLDKVDWYNVNKSGIMELLREYPDKIDLDILARSKNSDAVLYVHEHRNELSLDAWDGIAKNPAMINVIKDCIDTINIDLFYENLAATKLILRHGNDIKWDCMGDHPGIFKAWHPELVDVLST